MQVVSERLDPASGRHERVQRMSRQLGLEFWGDRVLRAWLNGGPYIRNQRTNGAHLLAKWVAVRVPDIGAKRISQWVSISVAHHKSFDIAVNVAK